MAQRRIEWATAGTPQACRNSLHQAVLPCTQRQCSLPCRWACLAACLLAHAPHPAAALSVLAPACLEAMLRSAPLIASARAASLIEVQCRIFGSVGANSGSDIRSGMQGELEVNSTTVPVLTETSSAAWRRWASPSGRLDCCCSVIRSCVPWCSAMFPVRGDAGSGQAAAVVHTHSEPLCDWRQRDAQLTSRNSHVHFQVFDALLLRNF